MESSSSDIVTAVLAGGQGRRLGGTIKATLVVAGHSLLTRSLRILMPQSAATVLCIAPRYKGDTWVKGTDIPVALDPVEDAGPLAGIAAALTWAQETMPHVRGVVTSPVDVPFLPSNLVARLSEAAGSEAIAVAESGDQRHHAIAYWPTALADELASHVSRGGDGAIHRWQKQHTMRGVTWSTHPYDPFFNINTADDLHYAAELAALADI